MKNKADKKKTEHTQNVEVSCLVNEMNGFCLKRGQGLQASAAHSPLPKLALRSPRGEGAANVLGVDNVCLRR